jgi:hypothetical protein
MTIMARCKNGSASSAPPTREITPHKLPKLDVAGSNLVARSTGIVGDPGLSSVIAAAAPDCFRPDRVATAAAAAPAISTAGGATT